MEDTTFIWRIEDSDGRGAYHAGMCYGDGNEVNYGSEYHPSPGPDGISAEGGFSGANLFGFQSIHHARRWFSSLHDLRHWEENYRARLVVYRREDCRSTQEGTSQMVFIPKDDAQKISFPASRLHDLPIKQLMENATEKFAHLLESVA